MDRTPPTRSPMINLNPTIFDNTDPTPPTRPASPGMPIVMARVIFLSKQIELIQGNATN